MWKVNNNIKVNNWLLRDFNTLKTYVFNLSKKKVICLRNFLSLNESMAILKTNVWIFDIASFLHFSTCKKNN